MRSIALDVRSDATGCGFSGRACPRPGVTVGRCEHVGVTAKTLRIARPGDELGVATVHVSSWQVGYRGLMAEEFLDGLRPEDRIGRYSFSGSSLTDPTTFGAELGNRICGFATIGACRDADRPADGELFALYVDPADWSTGVGGALLTKACDVMGDRGFTRAVLWMLAGNDRTERFYLSRGWRSEGAERDEDIWGVDAHVLRLEREL
jgi:GNAT superfamily N-acetyltransferase